MRELSFICDERCYRIDPTSGLVVITKKDAIHHIRPPLTIERQSIGMDWRRDHATMTTTKGFRWKEL